MRGIVFDEKVRSIKEIDTSSSSSPIKYKYRIKELYIKSFERRWHYSSREETNED